MEETLVKNSTIRGTAKTWVIGPQYLVFAIYWFHNSNLQRGDSNILTASVIMTILKRFWNRDQLERNPPKFGHPSLKLFGFEHGYINLNNGSFGSIPLRVINKCEVLGRKIEANPDKFFRLEYGSMLQDSRRKVAQMINADPAECVLVANATTAINTVLVNFSWEAGDIIVNATTSYFSVSRAVQYIADVEPHPTISTIVLNYPTTKESILETFTEHLAQLDSSKSKNIVVIIDGIVSNPGVRLPWEEMVGICKKAGVWSVVDAAHNIGQQPKIDVSSANPDFWISNCHKWLYAKRGCAVLYVPKRNQHIIKTTIPTSHYYVSPTDSPGSPIASNFIEQFAWIGTIDPVPFLSIPFALEFRKWLGGDEIIYDYCHNLALTGGGRLANMLGTRLLDPDGVMTDTMVNVELPLSGIPWSSEVECRIHDALVKKWKTSTVNYFHNGAWWTRCSVQIWNEISDFEHLGAALIEICAQIRRDYEVINSRETLKELDLAQNGTQSLPRFVIYNGIALDYSTYLYDFSR